MFNHEFKELQKALRGKVSMRIIKVTKTFQSRCECGEWMPAYCASLMECPACGTHYVAGSLRIEQASIMGKLCNIPIIVGACPKCHRRNISRHGFVNDCIRCFGKAKRLTLPLHSDQFSSMHPAMLLSEIDPIHREVHLTWGPSLDLATIQCRAKLAN